MIVVSLEILAHIQFQLTMHKWLKDGEVTDIFSKHVSFWTIEMKGYSKLLYCCSIPRSRALFVISIFIFN